MPPKGSPTKTLCRNYRSLQLRLLATWFSPIRPTTWIECALINSSKASDLVADFFGSIGGRVRGGCTHKIGEFQPEHIGKVQFYLTVSDGRLV
jgi:hypothetical protein